MVTSDKTTNQTEDEHVLKAPSISLPKGGDGISGMGEKSAANPATEVKK